MGKFFFIMIGICASLFIAYDIYDVPASSVEKLLPVEDKEINSVYINRQKISVEWARTPEERRRGLMYRKDLSQDHGMAFIFPSKEIQTFWNKDTLIPLDIIWIREKRVVGTTSLRAIQDGMHIITSPAPVDLVIELPKNWTLIHNIQIDDYVQLPF